MKEGTSELSGSAITVGGTEIAVQEVAFFYGHLPQLWYIVAQLRMFAAIKRTFHDFCHNFCIRSLIDEPFRPVFRGERGEKV